VDLFLFINTMKIISEQNKKLTMFFMKMMVAIRSLSLMKILAGVMLYR